MYFSAPWCVSDDIYTCGCDNERSCFMKLTLEEALRRGAEAHHAGELQDADGYFTAILKVYPKHADANHNMGILAVGLGRLELALPFFKTALEVNPAIEQFWSSYINTLIDLQHNQDVRRALKKAKKTGINPEVLKELEQRSRKNLSETILPSADPSQEQLQDLVDLFSLGKAQETVQLSEQLLVSFSNSATLYNIRGAAYGALKQFPQAVDSFQRVLEISPNSAEAYSNMGNALRAQGDFEAALVKFYKALEIRPDFIDAHYNLAINYEEIGELDHALDNYKKVLERDPSHFSAYNNLANILLQKGNIKAAIENYKQALVFKPDFAEAYNNLGNALEDYNDLTAALACYQRALELNPEYASAHNNYGSALAGQNNVEAGIESYQRAIMVKPDYQAAHAQKLHLQAQLCSWSDLHRECRLIPDLGIFEKEIAPFSLLCLDASAARHKLRAELFSKNRFKYKPVPLEDRLIETKIRLRIGYFSTDFQDHPVTHLIIRALELHDRDNFEVYAYSLGTIESKQHDSIRQRLVMSVDVFKDVSKLNVSEISMLARQDKIDIAIDLTGYTNNSRSGIFAYRAAPVQINYLGFPGTMGADFIDYIIVDSVLVPNKYRQHYSESLIRLPNSYMATDNTREISDAAVSRSDMGLPEHSFVFCAFNNSYKVTSREFDIWMRLLSQVESSVLWLRSCHKKAEENLRGEAEQRGVDSSRLIFAERVSIAEHLARHRLADLFLDTFIFNAHSTAVDALWAGLPIVTKLGEGFAARVAGSLLTSIDMLELVTNTEEAYEALALDLATNSDRLRRIQRRLSENLLNTPLFDSEQFTKHLESGYQQAYERYSDGDAPEDILVS